MKAILIPQDVSKSLSEVESSDFRSLAHDHSNIDWVERVSTKALFDVFDGSPNLVMLVDDEGAVKTTHWTNLRASTISGYPGPIFGDALILGETTYGEINFISAPANTLERLSAKL